MWPASLRKVILSWKWEIEPRNLTLIAAAQPPSSIYYVALFIITPPG